MKPKDKNINNQSDKPEKLTPKDSERKDIRHPQDDTEAVVKPENQLYTKKNSEFRDPQKRRVEREQPVTPIDKPEKNSGA